MTTNHKNRRTFGKLSILTIVAVYLLILVGGIVRSTGSGMGCPDWPKCFGSWVPPTSVEELPPNYQEIYSNKRAEKNVRFAAYLQRLGFQQLAAEVTNDPAILEEAEFNSTKTWIEYLNRLLGAVIGLLILGTFVYSLKFLKTERSLVFLAGASLILVIFQGWIGSIVVSTNLLPWIVTVHMLIALLIIAILTILVYKTTLVDFRKKVVKPQSLLFWVLLFGIVAAVIQIVLGTQVRESIDMVAASFSYGQRSEWIDALGVNFYIHRSYSILILAIHVWIWFLLSKSSYNGSTSINLSKILLAVIILEVATGAIMAYFAIPAFLQPVHLLLATVIFGIQFILLLLIKEHQFASPKNIIDA